MPPSLMYALVTRSDDVLQSPPAHVRPGSDTPLPYVLPVEPRDVIHHVGHVRAAASPGLHAEKSRDTGECH